MPPCPAFDAWLAFDRFLGTGEGPEDLWRDVSERWTTVTPASAVARANLSRGVPVPMTGCRGNPFAEDAGALGRAVFWGLAFQGRSEAAADWALWDASFDHSGEGVWTAVASAAAVASAVEGAALSDVLRAATAALDRRSKGAGLVSAVLQSMGESDPLPTLKARWDGELGEPASGKALSAFGAAVAGVALAKDTASAVTGAAGFGGAADQAGLLAGALGSLLYGPIAPEWTAPLGDSYVCSYGLKDVVVPETLTRFAERIAECGERADGALAWRPSEDAEAAVCSRGVRIEARFPNGMIERGSEGWQVALTLVNGTDTPETLDCQVVAPVGAETATRLGQESLEPGGRVTKGLIVRRTDVSADSPLTVHAGPATLRLPVLAPESWFVAGPFENESQDAYEATLPAERRQIRSDRFNGRSGLPAQWTEWLQEGRVYDVEPLFQFGPGAVVLYGRFRLPSEGPIDMVAAGAPGVSVTVDGQRAVRYNDYHVPEPERRPPYVFRWTPGDETTLVVKLVRDRRPAHPFVLLFTDGDGRVVEPVDWSPMDP